MTYQPFNHPVAPIWDTDPGPGPLPPRWPSLEEINTIRSQHDLPRLPSSRELTETLRDHGFRDCQGLPYLTLVPAEAAEEARA